MKKIIILLFMTGVFFMTAATAQEKEAARLPLENYLQGHATGNAEFHRKAFYPEARLLFVRDGKLAQRTSAEYIAGASGKAADDEAKRKRSIELIEVSGNAAIGKIVLDYPAAYFVDYFALLKIDGEWKIVNKSFHVQQRKDPSEKIVFKPTDADRKAASVPLENYLKAQATGDPDFIRQAFNPEAKIMWAAGGKFSQLSVEEFAGRFKGKSSSAAASSAADDSNRKRSFEIIDISGNAAIARVVLDYPTVKFTDYMTLLKIDGEWKIINKSFYSEPKAKTEPSK